MERNALQQQVDTLPDLAREMVDGLVTAVAQSFPKSLCEDIDFVYLTGCGDSHHAPVNAELAFRQLSGLPAAALTAMQFARYTAGYLPRGQNLVIGVSVSGGVSRTAEALRLARLSGAATAAVTGNRRSAVAQEADVVVYTAVPPLPDELQGMIVPGARSYIASQLALYLIAIHLGQARGHLTKKTANSLRRELGQTADLMEQTIAQNEAITQTLAREWADAGQFVYCGAGPNYGTAMFSAAKLLEASGDVAIAQDTEEWAHLQYFGREADTPTFIISAGERDVDRAVEIATAAKTIGRRAAVIAPPDSPLGQTADKDALLPIPHVRECFSPLLACLPGTLFAAARAELLGEPYFRNFGGGRSKEGGGGISRIRNSHQIIELPK
ncbi:MAG TPA: SIS domain-containing protein [Anaerolineae bacterium]|nr:SIS domain-containing protein [Anaerolineae bacterium]